MDSSVIPNILDIFRQQFMIQQNRNVGVIP